MDLIIQSAFCYVIKNIWFKLPFNLHPNEYSQEFYYYSAKLDMWVGSCNTMNDLCNKVCVPKKTEDLNLTVFNIIKGIN